jgi:hypothetical protein
MSDEKFELVLGVRDNRRAYPVQTSEVALSGEQVMHVSNFRQDGFAVTVHPGPHEVHQSKNQLAVVVLEAPEAVAALYGSYNWSQESLAHGNYMCPCFNVEVWRDAPSYFMYDTDHCVYCISHTHALGE